MDTATTDDDLHTYLRRIDVADAAQPSRAALGALVAGHTRSIPFENLDPLLGRPVADLRTAPLVDKLVHRRRGGYCYEQNGLLSAVLQALGYGVTALTGRVVYLRADGAPPPGRTHLALVVSVPHDPQRYLVDVGFGGQTLTAPIRFDHEGAQQTPYGPYRVVALPDGRRRLEAEAGDVWRALYVLEPDVGLRIDHEMASWYVSTHPGSAFVRELRAARVAGDARWNLRGRVLTVHRRGGTERTVLGSPAEVAEVLAGRFGLDLSGLPQVETHLARVLED